MISKIPLLSCKAGLRCAQYPATAGLVSFWNICPRKKCPKKYFIASMIGLIGF
jgi:hypothetical protein